jgi:ABC-type transport system involved in cytochrome c biogenesis permease subunit
MSLAVSLYDWLVPTGLAIGHAGVAARVFRQVRWLEPIANSLALAWGALLALTWVLRYRVAGHLPIFGTYESALSLALAIMVVTVVWEIKGGRRVVFTSLAALVAAALLAQGRRFDATPYALTISERSWVVDIHAIVAWVAFGVLAVNNFVALRLLLGHGENTPLLKRWLVVSLQIGFVLHTGMLISGSIYKFMLFGTAWSFDPIETLAIVAWLAYGTLLHLHLFAGWGGRRLAKWCLGVFVLLIVSYRCIVYFPPRSSYHILDMDRRLHVTSDSTEGVPQ